VHALALLRHLAPVRGSNLVALPVHCERARAEHLHPVHADIADAALGILRDHHRQRDVRPPVLRPACNDRQPGEINFVALEHHLLRGGLPASYSRRKFSQLQQPRQHRQLAENPFRDLEVEHLGYALPNLIELLDAQRERHAPH